MFVETRPTAGQTGKGSKNKMLGETNNTHLLREKADGTKIYRTIGERDGTPILLKHQSARNLSASEPTLRKEYDLLRQVGLDGDVEFHQDGSEIFLSSPDNGGAFLEDVVQESPMTAEDFLRFSIASTTSLKAITDADVVYGGLSPSTVLWNQANNSVIFVEFEAASRIGLVSPVAMRSDCAVDYHYIAPEQTGRLNIAIDQRADLYSLGCLFYYCLTGHPPFQAEDDLSRLYAHLAYGLPGDDSYPAETPQQIKDIIRKLTHKAPDQRYQTANGLLFDLNTCLTEYEDTGAIGSHILATQDISGILTFPDQLFGRKQERQAIEDTIIRSQAGSSELMLLSGLSGIGKSSLIESSQRLVLKQQGFYVTGLFDRYKSQAPYASLGGLLDDLIFQVQSGAFGDKALWADRISTLVGPGLTLLSRVALRLKNLVSLPRYAPELPASDIQRQLSLAIRRFLKALATREHQLFIALDDVQWADVASLRILEDILLDADLQHITVCLAYRSEEVGPAHPLTDLMSKVSNRTFKITKVELHALQPNDTQAFIAATLQEHYERAAGLSDILHQQCAGNPLVLQVLLKYLAEQNLLYFDTNARAWRWDVDKLTTASATSSEDLAEVMLERLASLPEGTKKLLSAAAVVGATCHKELLQSLTKTDAEAFQSDLVPALKAGLLLPAKGENTLGFVHARIEQAAYSLMTVDAREDIHLVLGRIFLQRDEIADDELFQAVRHLNLVMPRITSDERAVVQQLNARAGQRAEEGAAFEMAFEYYRTAVSMLTDDIWQARRGDAMALCLNTLNLAAIFNDRDAVTTLSDIVRARSTDAWELIHIDRAELLTANIDLDVAKSVMAGASALSRIGSETPLKPSAVNILIEIVKTKILMTGKKRAHLLALPWVRDEKTKLISELLTDVAPAAYVSNTEFWLVLVLRLVRHTVKEGLSPASVQAISSYGVLADEIFGDFKTMRMMTDVADTLATQAESPFPNRTLFATCYYNYHRFMPISEVIEKFKEVAAQSFEDGDIHWGCYSYNNIPNLMIASGQNLFTLKEQVDDYASTVERHGNMASLAALNVPRHFLHKMTGHAGDPVTPYSEIVTENDLEAALSNGQRYTTALYLAGQIYIEVLFGRYTEARAYADRFEPFEGNLIGTVTGVRCTALIAIAYLKGWKELAKAERRKARTALAKARKLLKARAKNAPFNYAHLNTLVHAAYEESRGNSESALKAYEQAAAQAHDAGFQQDRAWALEQMARLCLNEGRRDSGSAYVAQAIAGYRSWGAAPVCSSLDTEFEHLLPSTSTTTVGNERADRFDISMLVEASRLLASEIQLPELLRIMMQLMLTASGASQGVLLLKTERDGGVSASAVAQIDNAKLSVQVLEEVDQTTITYPQTIIDHAISTREMVVLRDAKALADFGLDPYIRNYDPKSVLVLPLFHKSDLRGVMYLENRLTSGAFTQDRCELSAHIANQAALSIENARLYGEMADVNANLESKVQERTEAVAAYSNLLDTTMTSMSEGLVTFDAQHDLSLWNERFEELLGTIGFVPTEGMNRAELLEALKARGVTTKDDGEMQLPDGTILVHRVKQTEGNTSVEVFVDVTADRKRERALEEAHKTLKDTQAQLVQAEKMASLGALVAGVAHEINTPLGTSITATSSLNARVKALHDKFTQGGMTKGDLKDFLEDASSANSIIESNLSRAAELVRSFKQVAADRTHDERRSFNLDDYVREVVASIAPIWNAGDHQVAVISHSPIEVVSYPGAVAQIITNLISNSVQHGFKADLGKKIAIELSNNNNNITVIYSDNGSGMSEDVLRNAFEPFFTTSRETGSTGLGLHLVYNVVKSQLGGTISLESKQGAGCTFTITMPQTSPALEPTGSPRRH